jgi:hypothetical protein
MKKRASKWLFASGAAGALSVALTLSVSAQQPAGTGADAGAAKPGTTGAGAAAGAGAAKADAGAVAAKTDAGAPADGGAVKTAATGDAGTTTSTSGSSSADGGGVTLASTTDGGTSAPSAPQTPPSTRKTSPPPPPPSPQQIAAYEALKAETDAYEQGARDYRDTVTTIIRLHYEAKKKDVLSGLDREIGIEKGELRKARDVAIKRLENFVAIYTGPRAQPEATPDAMYRLAALYEERARGEDATEDLSISLKPAIALYKRIINEFPNYKELSAIFYFLGHAYNDAGRTEEAQQVWRSEVCHNHFKYPTAPNPKNPEADTILPLPQDHDEDYWSTWRNINRDPKSLKRGGPDTVYIDPYPADCEPLPQPGLRAGDDPKYVGEVWWQIGNWEFDQLDFRGGVVKDEPAAVYDYNRAASAYLHSLQIKKPPVYGVALYKYAWTLFKQQRYEAATKEFVHLLVYTDELQKQTGDPGADFRGEAYTYIAGSLTNLDFKGPEPSEPYIQRPDIIDTEPKPEVAEQKLHIAIDRVRDPNLIPQDKPWTIEIYKALATEFRSLNQFSNAIEVYDSILKKWPMDPTAPEVQNAVAETYDAMNVTKRVGTPEHDAIAGKALEARTALANYIGTTPWTDANKDNPEALQNAERLVRGGLRQAAAAHTNNGLQAVTAAQNTGDPNRLAELLVRAQSEYKLAAIGWYGFLHQDENAPDAYESRYWLADARHQQVKIGVVLAKLKRGAEPTPKEIDEAKQAAIDVRDSNEDDKFLANAAFFVVDESDIDRDLAFQHFNDSRGTQGIEQRTDLRVDDAGKPIADPIPPQILASIQARDEYIQRVPANLDVMKNALEYQYYSAEQFFLYGHFDDARARFEPMYKEHCGKDKFGYLAWERLIQMSNKSGDTERSRQLATAQKEHSCAVSAEQEAKAGLIVNPTLQEAAYVKAREKFKEAQQAPDGPEKNKLWREAAGLYEAALSAAPARDEAPEAAMNAAYAYKQVGDFNHAIELYNKFITEYGSEERLNGLQKGDAKAKTQPDPKKYAERLQYLNDAYDALGTTYYSFFNYQRAAETKEKVSTNERFDEKKRKDAATDAMTLYNALGQRDKMLAQYKILTKLHPSADEQSKADYRVAEYDYQQWNDKAGDTGANRQARISAEQALMGFYNQNKAKSSAAKFALESAYRVARLKKTAGDGGYHQWFKTTITAWEFLDRAGAPSKDGKKDSQLPPYADYGAEAEFTLLDEEIHEKYDYDTGHHHYAGTVPDILGQYDPKTGKNIKKGKYQIDAEDADKYDKALEHISRTYPSLEWVPAAIARQGSLYDSLRTGLYNTVPPALKFFTPQQEALLKRLENSGRDDLAEQADNLRSTVKEGWRAKTEAELNGSDTLMVRRYATAVTLARKYNVRSAWVSRAIARLAYYTDIIGDAKMREYTTGTNDPTDPNKQGKLDYKDGQFVQSRPGLTAVPPGEAKAEPLPVAP